MPCFQTNAQQILITKRKMLAHYTLVKTDYTDRQLKINTSDVFSHLVSKLQQKEC